ncbi:hypothetical protein ACODM8_16905 [Vibrio ostreicida]|uniref:Uncharacterized protein n=1 Tax=Vibrio ostreicida TaxID=526588 RepID=A0ABT8BZ88_9VIBR|nr:hypothetical protein [Vibrio ostreicida]MDN3612009.1 hypothetical protein [Vibrio ostreicida]NPD08817.1 hypothetical protein [Vibrio ostreicida]
MLSASLFLVASLNILLLVIYGFSDDPGVAYGVEYHVESNASNYHGHSKVQIYFNNGEFEMTSVVEEAQEGQGKQYFEVHSKGDYQSYSPDLYNIAFTEHTSNFLDNERLPTLPIISSFYSAERYLSNRNTVEVKHRSDDYIVAATFINGGQILAMKRY